MSTLFIASEPSDLKNLLPWAAHIAVSRKEPLLLVVAQRKRGESRMVDLTDGVREDETEFCMSARQAVQQMTDDDRIAVSECRLLWLCGEDWKSDVASSVQQQNARTVIARAPEISRDSHEEDQWQIQLMQQFKGDVLLLQDDSVGVHQPLKLAVFVTAGADNETAFRYCRRLTKSFGGNTTAVYVQADISDDAIAVGERRLSHVLNRIFSGNAESELQHKVIVARSTTEAFRELNATDFHLLIMGTRDLKQMRRFLRASPHSTDSQADNIPAVAVLKKSQPLGSRLLNRFAETIQAKVPQLSREERISLVTRIQEASQWDFDFVFLISMATLIACLGLAENSGAVIVGAMLVAPLMTPIAGVGLGVAHANAFLTKVAFRTAIQGFLTALLLGAAFGLIVQLLQQPGWLEPLFDGAERLFPSQMEARTHPQFYDLFIAFFSGVAAAYAMGRPNLFSALPGVAIAAALVPPIATSGIALAHGQFVKSSGALVLFATNMVIIILGTALVFRMVGVRSQKEGPNAARWPRYVLMLLVLLSVLITSVIEIAGRT